MRPNCLGGLSSTQNLGNSSLPLSKNPGQGIVKEDTTKMKKLFFGTYSPGLLPKTFFSSTVLSKNNTEVLNIAQTKQKQINATFVIIIIIIIIIIRMILKNRKHPTVGNQASVYELVPKVKIAAVV